MFKVEIFSEEDPSEITVDPTYPPTQAGLDPSYPPTQAGLALVFFFTMFPYSMSI